ncbi:MAG: 5,6-dimethylbenzimidazole synthase [Nostocaceae cyanobacterium]|nr:5,6-dimethylbenzimidazole synthase [Nostocaceae cyanobacterium]
MKGRYFTEQERQILEEIIRHRRTELGENFLSQEIPETVLNRLIWAALSAPSVGFSQPWEFVIIRDASIKEKIKACFEIENEKAKKIFNDKPLYNQFKLEGIQTTPINIAIFYKPSSSPVLGQTSMKKAGPYSVCLAVQNLWLMARAENIGVCWLSILDEQKVKRILNAPDENELIAYLCIGYVKEFTERPQLEIANWETRKSQESLIYYDSYHQDSNS